MSTDTFTDKSHNELTHEQTALLFAQCMSANLPRKEGIPPEVRSWSEFTGQRMM